MTSQNTSVLDTLRNDLDMRDSVARYALGGNGANLPHTAQRALHPGFACTKGPYAITSRQPVAAFIPCKLSNTT